ncbi:MAG: hypothetical protein KC684_01145 [Candidatus Omnitrophica bacterium]|nr:hypothetical protein [Candidatus Omnitrophota bacterium]
MKAKLAFLVCLLIFLSGCGGGSEESSDITQIDQDKNEYSNPDFNPFYIYSDAGSRQNHYTPSGFMPNGRCIELSSKWTEGCQSGDSCIRIKYDVECSHNDEKWGGIYWLNPPNNWGSRKGGYNLAGAKKLTFWAKGQTGGEQIQEFTIGGIKGDYPDTDMIVIGPVLLTSEWQQYSIDLRGKDLSYISGGFAWSTSVDVNPADVVFYMDEIKFE